MIGLLYGCSCSDFFITVSAFELLSTGLCASLSIQVDLSNNKDTAVLMVVQVVPVVPDVNPDPQIKEKILSKLT